MPEEQTAAVVGSGNNQASALTRGLLRLASVGEKTRGVVMMRFGTPGGDPGFHSLAKWDDADVIALADALSASWEDSHASELVTRLCDLLDTRVDYEVDGKAIVGWAKAHANRPALVIDCAQVIPPKGFTIVHALSKRGSQKRVYLARWEQAPGEVVLKEFIGEAEVQDEVLGRELQSHPLSMRHPNIIGTHPLDNVKGQKFLVEEKLPFVLDDHWEASGVHEAANLLHDIAQALSYLHGELRRVHGDIKPDNIGRKDGAYILLDFGICRDECKFTREATATGSLRTRAPELFLSDSYDQDQARKVDVWSIGATVFKAVTGRFPFIRKGEDDHVPRKSASGERAAFEKVIEGRIRGEWKDWVTLEAVPMPLRSVLARVLVSDPAQRVSAAELVGLCRHKLAGYLSESALAGVAAEAELAQLLLYLPRDPARIRVMPSSAKQQIRERLRYLRDFPRVARGRENEIESLLAALG